jgi:hypothetical protein
MVSILISISVQQSQKQWRGAPALSGHSFWIFLCHLRAKAIGLAKEEKNAKRFCQNIQWNYSSKSANIFSRPFLESPGHGCGRKALSLSWAERSSSRSEGEKIDGTGDAIGSMSKDLCQKQPFVLPDCIVQAVISRFLSRNPCSWLQRNSGTRKQHFPVAIQGLLKKKLCATKHSTNFSVLQSMASEPVLSPLSPRPSPRSPCP